MPLFLGDPKLFWDAIRPFSFSSWLQSDSEGSHLPLDAFYCLRQGMVGLGKKQGQTKIWGSLHFLYIQTANQI